MPWTRQQARPRAGVVTNDKFDGVERPLQFAGNGWLKFCVISKRLLSEAASSCHLDRHCMHVADPDMTTRRAARSCTAYRLLKHTMVNNNELFGRPPKFHAAQTESENSNDASAQIGCYKRGGRIRMKRRKLPIRWRRKIVQSMSASPWHLHETTGVLRQHVMCH